MSKFKNVNFSDFSKSVNGFGLSRESFERQDFDLDLSDYTNWEDRRGDIITNIFAGSPTLSDLVPMTGVAYNTTVQLPILDTDVVWGDPCGSPTASGPTTLSPRSVTPALLAEAEVLCPIQLKPILPMIMAAGTRQDSLGGLAGAYVDLKVNKNINLVEQLAWRGNTVSGTGNLAKTNGYLAIALGETSALGYYATFSTFTVGAVAQGLVETIITNRSTKLRNSGVTIYVSESYFDIIRQTIITTYGINPTGIFTDSGYENQVAVQAIKWPGTDVVIKSTPGLNNDNHIFATRNGNLRYVTDGESDREDVRLTFNPYDNKVYYNLMFTAGFNYEMPEDVMLLKKV